LTSNRVLRLPDVTERDEQSFGEWMREARKRVPLTLAQAGHEAGVSESYVSKIESGAKMPSGDVLVLLAQAYGLPPDRVLMRAGKMTPEGLHAAARRPPFDEFVRQDPNLSGEQKRQLVSLYSLFTGRSGRSAAR
jgi:transcriptional regulator with XRE-family HTH domain